MTRYNTQAPPEIEPNATPELGGTGGVGGPVPMQAAAMNNEELGRTLYGAFMSYQGAVEGWHGHVGALARKLCAQPASSLPAGLVVRDHRVLAGGWESEPMRDFYVRYANGHPSGVHSDLSWPSFSKLDASVTGWCHADDFRAAINADGTAVPWVTRTAPRVEWLPWTEGLEGGKWFLVDTAGQKWGARGPITAGQLNLDFAVAFWPDPNAELVNDITAAILAGEVANG